jgi:hypothetical protein
MLTQNKSSVIMGTRRIEWVQNANFVDRRVMGLVQKVPIKFMNTLMMRNIVFFVGHQVMALAPRVHIKTISTGMVRTNVYIVVALQQALV